MNDMHREKYMCECAKSEQKNFILPKVYVSRVVAGAVLVAFATFTTGYFLGSRHASQAWCDEAHSDSFSDAIAFSLQTEQFDGASIPSEQASLDQENLEPETIVLKCASNASNGTQTISNNSDNGEVARAVQPAKKYAAAVMGGKQSEVRAFIKKMAHYGLQLEERRRESRRKGEAYVWYQAVIPATEDRDNLLRTIKLVEKHGNLKNSVTIVELKA